MRVFRIESRVDGKGPFSVHDYDTWGRNAFYLPPPYDDKKIRRHPAEKEHCAVTSLDDLLFWFDESFDNIMNLHNYLLIEYDCPDDYVTVGDYQVLFVKQKAEVITEIPLVEFVQQS